jgi:hypothetical protein
VFNWCLMLKNKGSNRFSLKKVLQCPAECTLRKHAALGVIATCRSVRSHSCANMLMHASEALPWFGIDESHLRGATVCVLSILAAPLGLDTNACMWRPRDGFPVGGSAQLRWCPMAAGTRRVWPHQPGSIITGAQREFGPQWLAAHRCCG